MLRCSALGVVEYGAEVRELLSVCCDVSQVALNLPPNYHRLVALMLGT